MRVGVGHPLQPTQRKQGDDPDPEHGRRDVHDEEGFHAGESRLRSPHVPATHEQKSERWQRHGTASAHMTAVVSCPAQSMSMSSAAMNAGVCM